MVFKKHKFLQIVNFYKFWKPKIFQRPNDLYQILGKTATWPENLPELNFFCAFLPEAPANQRQNQIKHEFNEEKYHLDAC